MIYFVDEDVRQIWPYSSELELRGFDVRSLDNADDGYDQVAAAQDVDLVIIDVMLATRESGNSRFGREETQDFLITGLSLIAELVKKRPDIAPSRILIFSMATTVTTVTVIERFAKDRDIPYYRKADYQSPFRFGEVVVERIKEVGGGRIDGRD